jgi:hypothetical protein
VTTFAKVDSKGRVAIGKQFASSLVIVKEIGEGLVQIVKAQAVPAPEAWLHKNPQALKMVMDGLREASEGELGEGPDMKEDKILRQGKQASGE